MEITLLNPKFYKPEVYNTGGSLRYLILGPFAAFIDRFYLLGLVHFFLSICTFGVFWIYYSTQVNKAIIRQRVSRGFIPATEKDSAIINEFLNLNEIHVSDIMFSRIGTCEGEFLKKLNFK